MTADRNPGRSLRRQQRADAVRTQILAAGRTCFGRSGLYETLVEEIAGEAGIAKGTFYLYFEDKEDLIRAVAQDAFGVLAADLAAISAKEKPWDERVRLIAAAHVRFFAQEPDRMRILHQLRGMLAFHRPEWQPLRVCLDSHLDLLRDLLFAAPRPAALTRGRAREIGGVIFGALSGVTSVWTSVEDDSALQKLPRGLAEGVRALAVFMGDRSPRQRRGDGV